MNRRSDFSTRLPHQPPMLMLTEVLQQDSDTIHCRCVIAADNPMLDNHRFPASAGIEPLAQAAGLLLAERSPGDGRQPSAAGQPGAIVQIKTFQAQPTTVAVGTELLVNAHYLAGNADAALFDGEVCAHNQTLLSAELMIALLPKGTPATTPAQPE